MSDIPNWVVALLSALLSMCGSLAGAYIAVRVATTRLETQMGTVQAEIEKLRKSSHRQSNRVQWAITAVEILLRHSKIDLPAPRNEDND